MPQGLRVQRRAWAGRCPDSRAAAEFEVSSDRMPLPVAPCATDFPCMLAASADHSAAMSRGQPAAHLLGAPCPWCVQEARIEVQGGVGGPTWRHSPFVDLHVASTDSFVTYTLVKVRPLAVVAGWSVRLSKVIACAASWPCLARPAFLA